MINIDSTAKNNIASFSKGLEKLLNLILNSKIPQLVKLSVNIAKLFLRNSKITKHNFISLFDKLGQIYNTKSICDQSLSNEEEKRYNILIEMNSPEIDYQFLINALYQWEEMYPTSLSEYRKNLKFQKENEIRVVTPPGKEIGHFIPLRKKETKTAHLENIVTEKIDIHKARLIEINDLLEGKEEPREEKKDESKDKKKKKKEKKESKSDDDKDKKSSIPEPPKKKPPTPEEIASFLAEIDLINVKIKYLNRILSHIKLCYKIGECASTRGYVIIENKYPKSIAEKFHKLIMSSFYNLSPQIPSEDTIDVEGNIIDTTTSLFKQTDIHPPLFTMEQLLPGCTNILKEITKPFITCLLVEANEIYPKLNKSIASFSSKTTNESNILSSQSKSQSVSTNMNEMSQHIVNCAFLSGESITCIIDYIDEFISYAISHEDTTNNDYEEYIEAIMKEKK